ncbi:glycoside hydrolase family 3 protein [Actinoplanes sp. TBRC 11911]|uniref:glycoside hydrolase family 3 protein n=1 Tax=Actinoplanes sp. TBRC 11911 TaxID=2729386 RepID=UPI00145E2560|nr:glycoside hydrolase family 3 protein [Actinoplanes sp. TBRC 11911]NMO52694.1 glycoside hydrolase family 3 protein [Actinoplanes sp. TBRC 11911]
MNDTPTLRRLALGTLLAAFPGHTAPEWAVRLLSEGLAGHTLFGYNVLDAAQVGRLTAALRSGRPDVLIAIDEEGGDVTRLAHRTGSPYPGNAALGAVDDVEVTRAVYAAIGADLAAAGVNLDLAPTVDVNTADDNPVIGTRSFGASTSLVARHAAAAVAGLQSAGVAACAKHFPGHGATVTDSHLALPVVDASLDLLRSRDLPPFAAAAAAGTQAIMTAHIRVPALTGTDPATFSRRTLVDLLREEYGFQGAIITDALEMTGAAAAAGGIPQAAVRALAAGADLLCIGAQVDEDLTESVAAEIVRAVEDGRLPFERLTDAVARNEKMAAWAASPLAGDNDAPGRMAAHTDADHTETPGRATAHTETDHTDDRGRATAHGDADRYDNPSRATTHGDADRYDNPSRATAHGDADRYDNPSRATAHSDADRYDDLGLAAARRAVRVEGSLADLGSPLVVQLVSGYSIAEGRVPWGLSPHLNGTEQLEVVAASASPDDLIARAGVRPIVVVGRHTHRSAETRALIEQLAAAHAVGVVEMGWPSSWRPANAQAFVITHGASRANARAAAEALGLVADR